MTFKIASIDIHKKLLVVVIVDRSDPSVVLAFRKFGTGSLELRHLREWLLLHGVTEVVMESTAQYWKPVWLELEPHLQLHLAQAMSNKAPKGRKSDLADAKRLARRFVADELILSFIPEPAQRSWRMITRGRLQLVRGRVLLQNQVESLLEEGRIKLSSVISDLLGVSGRRILRAMANGESDPAQLAALGDHHLQCDTGTLIDALTGDMQDVHRTLLSQQLDRIEIIDRQVDELNRLAATHMRPYQDAVTRLIEIPGIGAEAAQEIIAEIGPEAAAFPSSSQLASWIGVCPGSNESAGINHSGTSAKGNRFLRRLLCQAAQAAVRTKDSHLQRLYQKWILRMGRIKAIWAIAHRLVKIVWNVLRKGVRFVEHSEAINPKAVQRLINLHLKSLRRLGYPIPAPTTQRTL